MKMSNGEKEAVETVLWRELGRIAAAFYRLGVLDSAHRVFYEFNVGSVPEMAEAGDKFSQLYCDAEHGSNMVKHDVYERIKSLIEKRGR